MNYNHFIESRADILLGKLVIKGTRISVTLILKKLSEGASVQDVIKAYPGMTDESIKAVLAYA